MIKRIIDISSLNVKLSVSHDLLVIESQEKVTVPLTNIAALIVSSPAVIYTHAVLAKLSEFGAIFVCCDNYHLPIGMLQPLVSHSTQTQRFAKQILATIPFRKQIWKKIITRKIEVQAQLLIRRKREDFGLLSLSKNVKSGDEGNLEAQAAKIYWKHISSNIDFKRNIYGDNENILLNYGYAILRATIARNLCATGLNPSIGIFHKSKYNPFCLADDLMEPFRPLVDNEVFTIVDEGKFNDKILNSEIKHRIISLMYNKFLLNKESRQLHDIISISAQSLSAAFLTSKSNLVLPNLLK
ncbi:type II CRISPR-associated endonuclease Cas1 [Pigmentibacter sp. JX0631]|uniref:type II CRISPR-associated endonuclease Cas1 n=1 Tax=Pigmentibacter sp. JX0631 TaxID=2976982 RepID=UPI002469101A|nr:type II CRISPR-associated endonuclease Cas1 [Pigmentibacter sp. JX0631]WGL60088.1 type II CRISPR-associated endonuclease Cas1 [Pigmentibacter sp. JX0631]